MQKILDRLKEKRKAALEGAGQAGSKLSTAAAS